MFEANYFLQKTTLILKVTIISSKIEQRNLSCFLKAANSMEIKSSINI